MVRFGEKDGAMLRLFILQPFLTSQPENLPKFLILVVQPKFVTYNE